MLVAFAILAVGCSRPADRQTEAAAPAPAGAGPTATFVGGTRCADCHADEAARWVGSHHDLAMQVADASTVLGDFDDARYTERGVTTRFFRRDDEFRVYTEDVAGEPAGFRITHTFGVYPLQQYLVEMPGGRLQALTIAWDSRPAALGGQRWFSVYGDDEVDSEDPRHWTGVFQNWNTSCAACHSTNLVKHYDPAADQYATTYSSIDVDCEACHGPGSLHSDSPADWPLQLVGEPGARWVFPAGERIARREPARTDHGELDTCAQCHSRRGQFGEPIAAGDPLLERFRPALLEEGLYHADGQILDEVYVYGSFLQSRMYAAGVTCSDCHDPHSARLKADGNAVCAQCHLASAYEVPAHHHHSPGEPGSACVDCHMPAKNYIVVDPRRDHSFRVPRPDLSKTLDTPNACTCCHADRSDAWAAGIVSTWFPEGRSGSPHYGETLAASRNWDRDRGEKLLALAADDTAPAIVRATAIASFSLPLDARTLAVVESALDSGDALLQLAALEALAGLPAGTQLELAWPFIGNELAALRIAAARQLAPLRLELPQARRAELDRVIEEYRQAQAFNRDRAEGYLNIAALLIDTGNPEEAETALRRAIERQDYLAAPYINLADLYRRSGRDTEAEALLHTAVDKNPDDAAAHLALGLAEVRSGKSADALPRFRRAVELAPGEPYYRYVLGIALNGADPDAALAVLTEAHERFPGYGEITFALATMHRDRGETDTALRYARDLADTRRNDPAVLGLVAELEGRQR